MTKNLSFITLLALSIPTLAQAAPDLDRAMKNPNNWAYPRGQYNNQGYSELSQINTRNVKDLKLAWTFSTGVNRGHEGAPLVIDGVMYLHTAFPNNVYALDLNNDQKILWSYFPKQEPSTQAVLCCDNVNRGLGFGDGKIYLQQNNGVLVALDAKTGKVVWQVQVNDPKTGATNTNAPQVIKDKVLTGCAGGEFGVRCFMAAYYLIDGALAWKAYSTGSDADVLIGESFNKDNPQYSALSVYQDVNGGNKQGGSFKPLPNEQLKIAEKELGIRTWLKPQQEKDGWQNGGGAVTGYFSFDAKTNLVYYGTGNPGVWNPDVRPGDNKWASSVFARDVDTGQARWAMQTTPHDEWDYDATNEVILFEQKDKNNKNQTYATQINKNGFIYTWQADNGTLIAAEKVHPFVNWATGVDLKTGVPAKDPKYSTHQDYNAKNICPTNIGAKGISPAAYSPKTGLIYAPLSLTCMTYESVESRYKTGQPWVGATVLQYSWFEGAYKPQVPFGLLSAFSPLTNKVIWYQRENYSPYSGILVTSSNLVFHGTLDRWFKALDAKTGKELWQFQASSGVVGNTFSYSNKGKQYIGIMTGIGGWPNVSMIVQNIREDCGFGCPHGPFGYLVEHNSLPGGGALNIFSL
ncbi:MAG: PQQ-dependent dehydrogenase, methanol/ethanol family [Methylotenera sp.]|uniref:PQQ-dependent dehydrogenase, methanol/ethanol family n=1 Tax=Methylotenera sp. TaxID=2051956 RepID=UPI00181D4713|nr:PQQ-dependent dehydrogenase, methanol/ethanol family [Methylotenera sp.]NOU26170.1 PQQ-dependent dehydrogenase, methanol/ethanol family [Methylotenera sp.]